MLFQWKKNGMKPTFLFNTCLPLTLTRTSHLRFLVAEMLWSHSLSGDRQLFIKPSNSSYENYLVIEMKVWRTKFNTVFQKRLRKKQRRYFKSKRCLRPPFKSLSETPCASTGQGLFLVIFPNSYLALANSLKMPTANWVSNEDSFPLQLILRNRQEF